MVYRGWMFAVLSLMQAPAFAVQDFTVTREELAMLPPYCTVFYGKNVGLPDSASSSLRDTVPPGCPSLHHYCDALKAMIRVDGNRAESAYWLGVGVQTLKGIVADERWVNCSVKPEAHVNFGKALLRQGKSMGAQSAQAESQFKQALVLRPDYVPAYYALSDYYAGLGQKKKALDVVEDGLRHAPDSNGLLRRFTELGGKTPPVPLVEATPPAVPQPTAPAAQQAAPVEQHAAPERTAPPASSRAPQKLGTPSNPWCRFCPPE